MGAYKYLEEMMNSAIGNVHTSYLAKVLSVSGNTAKIQPLGLRKNSDGTTSAQSILSKVPICEHVKHITVYEQSLSATEGSITPSTHGGHVKITPIKAGDIVVVLVCEQNISEAKRGINALPPAGRFSKSDSIIIGVL